MGRDTAVDAEGRGEASISKFLPVRSRRECSEDSDWRAAATTERQQNEAKSRYEEKSGNDGLQ